MEFDAFTKDEILQRLFAAWRPVQEIEEVPLDEAVGRISAVDIVSRITLPVVRSSMMDGYAVRSEAFIDGPPDTEGWKRGVDYVRADTGDDFDDRFDAVVKVEDVEVDGAGVLHFAPTVSVVPGGMVNRAGSMIKPGDLLVGKGLPIRPFDTGPLAMGGITQVPVVRKPKIAFIPTGSELIPAGQTPQRGQNIDANSVMCRHMLREAGADVVNMPIVKDDPELLRSSLEDALRSSDIVIVNGGSSKGEEDFNARLLEEMGQVICHGVLAAPGRPICVALIDGKPVINSPGPMLALFYVLEWCIAPLIARALGVPTVGHPTVEAILAEDIAAKPTPDGKAFEVLRKMLVTATEEGFTARQIASRGKAGPECKGFSNGQFINRTAEALYPAGSAVAVEILYPPEYL